MTDAAIHRVSREADDLSLRFPVHSGLPLAFRPCDNNKKINPSPMEETFGVLHSTHLLHRLIPQWGLAKPNHFLTTQDQDAFPILAL